MEKTNGTIGKNWLNNTAIQKQKRTWLNRQVSKFTNSCQSLLTAFVNPESMLVEIEILIQNNPKIFKMLYSLNYLYVNDNTRSMDLCF